MWCKPQHRWYVANTSGACFLIFCLNCAMLHNTDSGSSFAHESVSWKYKETDGHPSPVCDASQCSTKTTRNPKCYFVRWFTTYSIPNTTVTVVKWDQKNIYSVNWNTWSNDLCQSFIRSFVWWEWQNLVRVCPDYLCTGRYSKQVLSDVQMRWIYNTILNSLKYINVLGPKQAQSICEKVTEQNIWI